MGTLRREAIQDGAKRDRRGRRILLLERTEVFAREHRAIGLTQERLRGAGG